MPDKALNQFKKRMYVENEVYDDIYFNFLKLFKDCNPWLEHFNVVTIQHNINKGRYHHRGINNPTIDPDIKLCNFTDAHKLPFAKWHDGESILSLFTRDKKPSTILKLNSWDNIMKTDEIISYNYFSMEVFKNIHVAKYQGISGIKCPDVNKFIPPIRDNVYYIQDKWQYVDNITKGSGVSVEDLLLIYEIAYKSTVTLI
jgi:hypothetical protein